MGVGLLSRRLVLLKQIPHISIKQQHCFGTALKTDPGGHLSQGVCGRIEAKTIFGALLFPSSLKKLLYLVEIATSWRKVLVPFASWSYTTVL